MNSKEGHKGEHVSNMDEQLDKFEKLATALLEAQPRGNTNTQTTTIDAGSKALWFGLWLATSCCIAMFFMFQADRDQLAQMQTKELENSRKLEADADRLSILLQWAPNLRDEVNKEMKDKEKSK